ncbi:MAG TPA: VanZ family protein, partial [Chthoniobacteraceae bacterium]
MLPKIPAWLHRLSWIAVAGWAATITFLSSMSGPELEELDFKLWDKGAHFIAFLVGGLLLGAAWRWSVGWPWKKLAPLAILALMLFGAIDEIHQLYTPNRSGADLADWIADVLGSAAGVLLFLLIH